MERAQKLIAAFLGIFLLSALPALGQELRVVGQIRSSGPITSEASQKIVSRLRGLIADFHALGIAQENAAALDAAGRFSGDALKVNSAGRVQIYVWVTDTSEQALDALRRHGFDIEVVNKDFGIVQGWIPVENIEALAAEPVVVKVRPPSYGTHDTGPVDSQGDSIHRCDQARTLGFNGAGVKVGVVSDGVSGLTTSQAAGELGPVQVHSPGSGDEGTAMLEIIADCAPGAELAFATSGSTSLEFIQAVNSLRDAGAQIIVDDTAAFVTEPVFEDSTTALNDRAVGATVLRVSSAGNRGLAHYTGTFSPGIFDPEVSGTRHDFGGGDTLLRFAIPASPMGLGILLVLQWGNRFGAAGDNYDLCVRQTNGSLFTCSSGVQDGNDDPIEIVLLGCTGPVSTFCAGDAQITLVSGSPQPLQLFCELPCQFTEFNVRGGSVVGHKAVPEVLAVAASPASNPGVVESFSSAGPSTILFPSVQVRSKPDLDGIDGVATSRPGFNPFFGTSAAAPHVAAVAAILMQRMGAGATVQAVQGALKATATDLGAAGFDFDFGAGRADAVSAVRLFALVAAVLPSSRSVQVGTTATAFATIINSNSVTAIGCGLSLLTSLPATFMYQTTDPATNQVTGAPNTPVNIAAGAAQSYVFALSPSAPVAPVDVQLNFGCANTNPTSIISGLNTLLFSASDTPVPDIVALAATPTNDGIVNISGAGGTGVFSVATVNVGVQGVISASADTGATSLPLTVSLCETNSATGQCISGIGSTVTTTINANATPTFGIFVQGSGNVPFDPAANRIFVRFKDGGDVTRGSTSVAARTQ
jgi:hypothetical protein